MKVKWIWWVVGLIRFCIFVVVINCYFGNDVIDGENRIVDVMFYFI